MLDKFFPDADRLAGPNVRNFHMEYVKVPRSEYKSFVWFVNLHKKPYNYDK